MPHLHHARDHDPPQPTLLTDNADWLRTLALLTPADYQETRRQIRQLTPDQLHNHPAGTYISRYPPRPLPSKRAPTKAHTP